MELKTLKDLKNYLNTLPDHVLEQKIIFGLTDDTLEDSWEITGLRPITQEEAEEDCPVDLIAGNLIFYP